MVGRLSGFEGYSGAEWEELCLRVLHEHHPGHMLVEVPDQDQGDAGLEAFSLDGCAYQCYAPENEPLDTTTRFERQRDKMTDDVKKFVENRKKIAAILPVGLRIDVWILLVPHVNSRRILEHAAKKTASLRAESLPYASDNIIVTIQTLSSFERARAAVISRQLSKLDLPPVPSTDFSEIEDALIDVMAGKLQKTGRYASETMRKDFMDRLLANQIAGKAHREHVRDEYPELGDELEERLSDLEDRLTVQYALDEPVPDRRLNTVIRDTESIVESILNTRPRQSRVIAEGQIADWLIRCPLDFE